MNAGDAAAWRSCAALLGRLLVRELDAETLVRLRDPAVARELSEMGLALPEGGGDEALIERLAAEYFDAFVGGAGAVVPVQSLRESGGYEGVAAAEIRALAKAAGLDFDKSATRGAPPDHLGSILLLWAAFARDWPDGAKRIEERHLAWALPVLARVAKSEGTFYGALARASAQFIAATIDRSD